MESNLSLSISGHQAILLDKWTKVYNYLCGLAQSFAYVKRSSNDPRLVCIGSELTGVHRLLNRKHPGLGGYHIGGVGTTKNDALIKAMGELQERYAQLVAEYVVKEPFQIESFNNLKAKNEPVLSEDQLHLFTPDQYKNNGFPFAPYNPDQKIGWYLLASAANKKQLLWIPAQFLFLGYTLKKDYDEPWINTAVTTGTATHSVKAQAKLSAILELIQMDCAIGYWYSNNVAKLIEFDDRLEALKKLLEKYAPLFSPYISFHIFESPENWSSFSVACVYRRQDNNLPKIAIGLGADLSLEQAMYKAFLECYAVIVMCRYELLYFDHKKFDLDQCYDIDSNVCYHALGYQFDLINQKFPHKKTIKASQLPADVNLPLDEKVECIVEQLTSRQKQLYECEILTPEAEAVGFYNYRVWSSELLSLCFPSAPWKNHQRFKDYGGIAHELPHPYP